jgi:hypothetical protein
MGPTARAAVTGVRRGQCVPDGERPPTSDRNWAGIRALQGADSKEAS